jgi:hypothetical protein
MTPDRTRKTRKESMSFKREGVVLRYAAQSVWRAIFDADVAAGEEVDDVEATVWVFARLDALAVLGVAEACFAGVLGPAIAFTFFALSWSNTVERVCECSICGSWSSRRVQSAVPDKRCRGPRGPAPFRERVYFRNFSDCVFICHAPSRTRTQPRHSSGGLLKNDKCSDAASCKLAAPRRRQVDTTPMVSLAEDDPRPCPAPL